MLKKLEPNDDRDPPTRDDSMAAGALLASCMGFVVLYLGGLIGIGLAIFVLKTQADRDRRDRGIAITAIVVSIISLIVSGVLTWIMIKWNREFSTIG